MSTEIGFFTQTNEHRVYIDILTCTDGGAIYLNGKNITNASFNTK